MARQRNIRAGRRGFTLVEISIATVILIVAVLGTFVSQLKARDLIATSRQTSVAMADLRAVMEQLLLRPPNALPIAGSLYEAGQPVAAFEGLHLRDERIVVTYPGYVVGADVPDPLPVLATATWLGANGERRAATLRSLRTR